MSSHHVVRDKQEPALLILGLDNFPDESLGQLLEWSPTVITTPATAEKLAMNGIKIDWMVSNNADNIFQSDIQLLPAGKKTLTGAALTWLTDLGYPAVNIVTDELKLNEFEYFINKINLVILFDHKKIYPVNPGFNKWKPAGEIIHLLTQAVRLNFTGLECIQQ